MKRMAKWIIAGIIIILIGAALLIAGLAVNGWHWNVEFEQRQFVSQGEVTSLNISAGAGKVRVEYADCENVEIIYPYSDNAGYTAAQTDGQVKLSFSKNWFSFFTIGANIPETVVKLPNGFAPDVEISVGAGSLTLPDGTFGRFETDIAAGTLNGGKIICESADIEVSAGTMALSGLVCNELELEVSAGSADIASTDCPNVSVEVSAGSASLKLAGAKSDYNISVDRSAGSCNVSSQLQPSASGKIEIKISAGSVAISFAD